MQLHHWEKEQFKKLFNRDCIDRFEDRFRILEIFLQHEQHLTIEHLAELLRQDGADFEIDFIHDTLRLMCDYGFASRNYFDNGEARYEHRHLGQHHDHMICTKCRRIIEFEDEALDRLQAQIAATRGFHMLQHKAEIYGICQACMKEQQTTMLLIGAKAGETLRIKEFKGCAKMRMRLLSMGIRPGDRVSVISNQKSGQVVVAVDCARFALGRGLAQKVVVEPVTTAAEPDPDRECDFKILSLKG